MFLCVQKYTQLLQLIARRQTCNNKDRKNAVLKKQSFSKRGSKFVLYKKGCHTTQQSFRVLVSVQADKQSRRNLNDWLT